ncbi:MAG: pentapeptide repeat-containing protein [Magnetococcus sp. DMHC-8]
MEATRNNNIWPGPKPYDERDWKFFVGRESEVRYTCDRVKNYRLSVLSGDSGSGKTSLLRAGVVAELRRSRYAPIQRTDCDRYSSVTLVLRDWTVKKEMGLWDLCRQKVAQSFSAIHEWGMQFESPMAVREAEILRNEFDNHLQSRDKKSIDDHVEEVMDWFAHLGYVLQQNCVLEPQLMTPVSGFVLIFDQLEELIRANKGLSTDVIELVYRIVESNLPIQILLSLRHEHIGDLRRLDQLVDGLINKTYFLKPMALGTAMEVIRSATKGDDKIHVNIDDRSLDHIKKWLIDSNRDTSDDQSHSSPDNREERVELIKLQAVLRELFDFILGRRTEPANELDGMSLDITIKDLLAFERALKDGKRGSAREVVQNSLQRWISKSVAMTYLTTGGGGTRAIEALHAAFDTHEERLIALVKRIAVRIAPHLSSGGYKVAQESTSLFCKALGDDILALIGGSPTDKELIKLISGETEFPVLDMECLLPDEDAPQKWAEKVSQSGLAKEKDWTAQMTAEYLVLAFHETLGRMQQSNILKASGSSWELVHDQMGKTLTKWAENHRNTWDDCVASTTLVSGVTPLVIKEDVVGEGAARETVFSHLRWYGCNVRSYGTRHVEFRNVSFDKCAFNGTIFDKCVFRGCTFVDCTLHGVLFRDCKFVELDENNITRPMRFVMRDPALPPNNAINFMNCIFDGVEFDRCQYNQLVVSSRKRDDSDKPIPNVFDTVHFKECKIRQFYMTDTRLDGPVVFVKSEILQGYFSNCRRAGGKKEASIRLDPDSLACFCSGEQDSWNLIQPDQLSSLVSCSVETTVPGRSDTAR